MARRPIEAPGNNPTDIVSHAELITPVRARELIESNHASNRTVSKTTVDRYVEEMREGRWQHNPQGIVITKDNVLLDGQHRMYALLEYGKPLWFQVSVVPSEEYVRSLDRGRSRSHGDILEMSGLVERGKGIKYSSMIKTMVALSEANPDPRGYQAHAETVLAKHGKDIADIIGAFRGWSKVSRVFMAPAVYVYPCDREKVKKIITRACENDALEKGTGAWHLNKMMQSSVRSGSSTESFERSLQTLRAFMLEFEGRKVDYLRSVGSSLEDYVNCQQLSYFRKLRVKCGVGERVY